MKGRLALLILLLATALTLASVNHEVPKVEKYAESIEFGQDIIHSQIGNLAKVSDLRLQQVEKLQKELEKARETHLDLLTNISLLESRIRKEQERTNQLLGIDGKYDANNVLIAQEELNKFVGYKIYVRTTVLMEKPEGVQSNNGEDTITRIAEAPGIVIGKYIFMASHTNDPDEFSNIKVALRTPFGTLPMIIKAKILEYKAEFLLNRKSISLTEKYRNREKDFSLFEIPEGIIIEKFPFKVGQSSELNVGSFLYINGRPVLPFEVARPGYVTALSVAPKNGNDDVQDQMEISQSIDQGDSGSPIIAFRDGKPELIGICLGWLGEPNDNGKNTRSRVLKINSAMDEIKEKLGIDLRTLQNGILSK